MLLFPASHWIADITPKGNRGYLESQQFTFFVNPQILSDMLSRRKINVHYNNKEMMFLLD